MLPALRVGLPPAGDVLALPGRTWLEIGFGGGEHLAAQAQAHPDVTLLGVEPFTGGVAKLLGLIEDRALANVRIFDDDARLLVAALPDAAVERCFVLFPDPWPKKRHWKRRILQSAFVRDLARVLVQGGELRIATDHVDHLRWVLAVMLDREDFAWLAERASDWRVRPADWPATRYEQKAVAQGRRPVFLRFRRR